MKKPIVLLRFLLVGVLITLTNYPTNSFGYRAFGRGPSPMAGRPGAMGHAPGYGPGHGPIHGPLGGPHFGFVPAHHWGPGFYGYYHTPWYHPVAFRFGWWYSPWYTPYVYYFQPYPIYAAPSYWLTDYVIANILAAEYAAQWQAQMSAPSPSQMAAAQANQSAIAGQPGGAVLDESAKEQIHNQVEEAVKSQQSDQPLALSSWVNDPNHIFLVTSDFNASLNAGGQITSCALSHGDLLKVQQPPVAGSPAVSMRVITSKRESCPAGSVVEVAVEELQKFQNDFAKTVDQGLYQMQQVPQLH
jgi:chorismate mutase